MSIAATVVTGIGRNVGWRALVASPLTGKELAEGSLREAIVRDSLLVIAVLGIIAASYVYIFKDKPFVYSPSALLKSSQRNKGELSREDLDPTKHSGKTSKGKIAAGQNHSESGETSGASSKLEELPHLYSGKGKPVKKLKRKFVLGVPVEGLVHDRKNQLALRSVAPDTNAGMKVYMQCMELKGSGARPITPQDCHALAERPRAIGLQHALGGVQ